MNSFKELCDRQRMPYTVFIFLANTRDKKISSVKRRASSRVSLRFASSCRFQFSFARAYARSRYPSQAVFPFLSGAIASALLDPRRVNDKFTQVKNRLQEFGRKAAFDVIRGARSGRLGEIGGPAIKSVRGRLARFTDLHYTGTRWTETSRDTKTASKLHFRFSSSLLPRHLPSPPS